MSSVCDIVVVGGGAIGVPAALALAGSGWRVTLIDREAAPTPPVDPLDERCTALSRSSIDWLDRHGLWDPAGARAAPIRQVQVSQLGHPGLTRLVAEEEGVDALGQVVENRAWLASLWPEIERRGVTRIAPAEFVSLDQRQSGVVVRCRRDGGLQSVEARLVIGADGVGSRVRDALGIGIRQSDYRQSALLCNLRRDAPLPGQAFERFTPEGAMAVLPRPGETVHVVRCVGTATAKRVGTLDEAAWLSELQSIMGERAGRFVAAGPRSLQPLALTEARRQIGARALLLGNANRLLHPVAGQGYNLALRDLAMLVSQLAGERDGHFDAAPMRVEDPGAALLLRAYVRSRTADQRRTVRLVDSLARYFLGRRRTLATVRGAGLLTLDMTAPLRHRFARLCMGPTL